MADPFVPEKTQHFRARMDAASPGDRERVRGKAVLKVFGRTLSFILVYKWRVAFELLLIVIGSLLALLPPILLGQILIDNVLSGKPVDPGRFDKLLQAKLIFWLTHPWHNSGPGVLLWVAMIGFLIVQGMLSGRQILFIWWDFGVKNRILQRLRTTVVGQFLRLGLRPRIPHRVGDIIWRVQNDSDSIRQFYQRIFVEMWGALIGICVNLASLFAMNLSAALVAMSVVPMALALNFGLVMPLRRAARRLREANSEVMSKIDATFSAIRSVIAFGRETHERTGYRDISWQALTWERRYETWRVTIMQSVAWSLQFGYCALMFYAAHAVWKGTLTVGQWTVLSAYYMAVQTPISSLTLMWGYLQTNLVGLDRVYTVLDQKPDVEDRHGAKPLRQVRESLEFRNVSCEYEPGRPAVKNVSFVARIGTVTAIVGPVGAGKTSLISCIPRFLDPAEGAVLIDGVDIREYTVESLRSHVSIALQESRLFSASILENILYGVDGNADGSDPERKNARSLLRRSGRDGSSNDSTGDVRWGDLHEEAQNHLTATARKAGLDDVIDAMPQGYDTAVNDHSSPLNGSEKQRIAVARALLRHAPILILDEPAGALDAANEAQFLDAIREYGQDHIVFIVANRLAAASRVDQVLFMQDGQIVESGPHDELMKRDNGRYREFSETHSVR